MSKKIKLEFTAQELNEFNRVWAREEYFEKKRIGAANWKELALDKMSHLLARELAVTFLKKAVGAKAQKNTITLKEYQAIGLKVYLNAFLIHEEINDIYFQKVVEHQFWELDQKTV